MNQDNLINAGYDVENNGVEPISLGLPDKVKTLPTNPGIYQFKNEAGKIIYIGKAKNLRNRVRSYFQNNRPVDAKTKALQKNISSSVLPRVFVMI